MTTLAIRLAEMCSAAFIFMWIESMGAAFSDEGVLEPRVETVVTLKRREDGIEGKGRFTYVNLKMQNRTEKPMWVVFPAQVDLGFPANGVFKEASSSPEPFPAYKIPSQTGAAIRISLPGGAEALRIPGKGRFQADGYLLMSSRDIDRFSIMEAEELNVNGKTPLQKWLPFEVTCGNNVQVDYEKDFELFLNVVQGTKNRRTDFPKEQVDQVVPSEFKVRLVEITRDKK